MIPQFQTLYKPLSCVPVFLLGMIFHSTIELNRYDFVNTIVLHASNALIPITSPLHRSKRCLRLISHNRFIISSSYFPS